MKLRGVGKYPHVLVRLPVKRGGKGVSISTTEKDGGRRGGREGGRGSGGGCGSEVVVSFGSVAVGTSTRTEREIELVNVSAVSSVRCEE